jgi:hypothetical protein
MRDLEHRGAAIHPSHVTEQAWDVPDPHSPGERCTICRQYACALCDLEADDDLAQPCPGKPWWDCEPDEGME